MPSAARLSRYRPGTEILSDKPQQSLGSVLGQDCAVVTAFGAPYVIGKTYRVARAPVPSEQLQLVTLA
jgi:hypothetical protein